MIAINVLLVKWVATVRGDSHGNCWQKGPAPTQTYV
jgi:hypothetical protein